MTRNKAILSIAGSDPSGGAGIQADIKTLTVLGVYGAAAVTCLTAQNTRGVRAILPVAPDFVREQIEAVLADLPVTHIKIGMLGTGEIARAVGSALDGFAGEVVCDPVLTASDGHALLANEALADFFAHVLAKSTVLTPNIPELERISSTPCSTEEGILAAAEKILKEFPNLRAVVATGGHLDPQRQTIADFLCLRSLRQGVVARKAEHPRIRTANTHGTGCTFASAFAACHLLTGDYEPAFFKTVGFMDSLLRKSAALPMGHGNGPLAHHACSAPEP